MENEEIIVQLLTEANRGNRWAFFGLFNYHHTSIHCHIYEMIKNNTDAEDLTMATFEKAFHSLNRYIYMPIATYYTWLTRIATNTTLDFIKEKRTKNKPQGFFEITEITDDNCHLIYDAQNPEEQIISKENVEIIERAINEMSPVLREIYQLRFDQNLTCKKIADKLDISINTVMGRIRYVRKSINQNLIKMGYFEKHGRATHTITYSRKNLREISI